MTTIAASSIDWHVEWHGPHGLPVLCLVHGFAGNLHTWDALLPELPTHFRLLLVDLPGHGKTPLPREGGSQPRTAGDCPGRSSSATPPKARRCSAATAWAGVSRCTPRSSLPNM